MDSVFIKVSFDGGNFQNMAVMALYCALERETPVSI